MLIVYCEVLSVLIVYCAVLFELIQLLGSIYCLKFNNCASKNVS